MTGTYYDIIMFYELFRAEKQSEHGSLTIIII